MKDTIKNGLIVALVILIGLFAIFGGKAVKRFKEDIATLKYDKSILQNQIIDRENQIKVLQAKTDTHKARIDSCMGEFQKKDKVIAGLKRDLNEALSELDGISSDSSYIFLTKIAYNYPGFLSYLFNENQIKAIHADYLRVRNAEKVVVALNDQINNCRVQFAQRDSLANSLKTMFGLSEKNLADCQKINQDNEKIIKDVTKERNAEKRRKNFWRFTTGTMTIVEILTILALAV